MRKFRVPAADWGALESNAEMQANHNRVMGLVVLLYLPEQNATVAVDDVAGRLADALEQISMRYQAIPELHKGPVRAFRRKQAGAVTTVESLHASDLHANKYINNLRVVVMPQAGSTGASRAEARELVAAEFKRVFAERRTGDRHGHARAQGRDNGNHENRACR